MATGDRTTRCFSLDKSIGHEIELTIGTLSISKRVNELLRAGLAAEKRAALHLEVAAFFAQGHAEAEKEAHDAYQTAAVSAMIAEGD
jgi:hypothetical protein